MENSFRRVLEISDRLLSRCPRVGSYPNATVFPKGTWFESEANNLLNVWREFKQSFESVLSRHGLCWDDLFKAYMTLISEFSKVSSKDDLNRLLTTDRRKWWDAFALAGKFYPSFLADISHPLVFSKILPAIHPEKTEEYFKEAKILASLIGLAMLRKRIEEVRANVITVEDLRSTIELLKSYHFDPLSISV
jgi:hypothetical protein